MLGGARRRHPNYLAMACSAINQALRIQRRLAKQDPHIFGPRAHDYYLDTLRMEQREQEAQAALHEVYGPPAPGEPNTFQPSGPTVTPPQKEPPIPQMVS